MILNYEAYSYPDCQMFRFHAKDDKAAKKLMKQHMKELKLEKITIQPLEIDEEDKQIFKDIGKTFEINQPQEVRKHEKEYKLEISFFRYIKFVGTKTEREFNDEIRKVLDKIKFPKIPGWYSKHPRKDAVGMYGYDDDRYGAEPDVKVIE